MRIYLNTIVLVLGLLIATPGISESFFGYTRTHHLIARNLEDNHPLSVYNN